MRATRRTARFAPVETRHALGRSLGDHPGEEEGYYAALLCASMGLPMWFAGGIAVALYRFLHGTLGRIVGDTSLVISVWCGISVTLVGAPVLVPLTRVLGTDRSKNGLAARVFGVICAWSLVAGLAVALFSPQYDGNYAKRTQIHIVWSDDDPDTGATACIRSFDAIPPMHVAHSVFPTLAWSDAEEVVARCHTDPALAASIVAAPVSTPGTPLRPEIEVLSDDALPGGRRNVTVRFTHEGTYYARLGFLFPGIDEWSMYGPVPPYNEGLGLDFRGGRPDTSLDTAVLPSATEHVLWVAGELPEELTIWGVSALDHTVRSGARPEDSSAFACEMIGRWMSDLPPWASAPLRTSCEPSVTVIV